MGISVGPLLPLRPRSFVKRIPSTTLIVIKRGLFQLVLWVRNRQCQGTTFISVSETYHFLSRGWV